MVDGQWKNPQNLVHCAWACGKLYIESPKLFQLLNKHAELLLVTRKSARHCNLFFACGAVGIEVLALVKLFDERAEWSSSFAINVSNALLDTGFDNERNFFHKNLCPAFQSALPVQIKWLPLNATAQTISCSTLVMGSAKKMDQPRRSVFCCNTLGGMSLICMRLRHII